LNSRLFHVSEKVSARNARGVRGGLRGMVMRVPQGGGLGTGDGRSQSLNTWGDGFDLYPGTEWSGGARCVFT